MSSDPLVEIALPIPNSRLLGSPELHKGRASSDASPFLEGTDGAAEPLRDAIGAYHFGPAEVWSDVLAAHGRPPRLALAKVRFL